MVVSLLIQVKTGKSIVLLKVNNLGFNENYNKFFES